MSVEFTLTPEETVEVLDEASARNVPLELHAKGESGDLHVVRTRVLGMDDEQVYLDGPQCSGKEARFAGGERVVGHVTLHGVRYEFGATVAESTCIVKLNERHYVRGMSLRRPQSAHESQRRCDYRISFARFDPVAVWMHESSSTEPGTCPRDAKRHRVRLVNISLGGMAVRISMPPTGLTRVGQQWFLLFTLPQQPKPFVFLAEIRHVRGILDGQATLVGLQFVSWPDRREMQRQLNSLSRYLSEVQRSILAKGRIEVAAQSHV